MNCGAGVYNLCIYQGTTYNRVFLWTVGQCCGTGTAGAQSMPVDLTGYTASMQFRMFPGAPLLYDASADLTLGGPLGTIALSIDAIDTDGFTWFQGSYDLFLTSPTNTVTALLKGQVTICPAITMPPPGQAIQTDSGVTITTDSGVQINTSS
jgi:hypothetical protein